ncbi:MAG: hypothetical protein JNM72_26290 [Deltaproteobacteria bacterium]|nr:hypothetical protein [Deltaproteobacteria bacterium]
MERALRRHPLCRALVVYGVTSAGCADAPEPKADPTCADYREALDACMAELGLAHGLGGGVAQACVPDALTASDRAYFQCVTEVLDGTQCDAQALTFVREQLQVCHSTHLAEAG